MINENYFDSRQMSRIVLMKNIAENITSHTKDNFVLKGGTGLLIGYGLNRFSTDLDFDGKDRFIYIDKYILEGARKSNIDIEAINIKKDTDTTKRYSIHYKGYEYNPLKIEISYRQAEEINENDINIIDGIRIYKLEKLAELKAKAFLDRTNARDIYDISFILERYKNVFDNNSLMNISEKKDSIGINGLLKLLSDDNEIFGKYDCEAILLRMEDNIKKSLHPDSRFPIDRKRKPDNNEYERY
jgi:predicted nucleotidyltransferase component of viral defense system